MPAAAGRGGFDGNARCMCTDALLAFTCGRSARGGGRRQLASGARLAGLFCSYYTRM